MKYVKQRKPARRSESSLRFSRDHLWVRHDGIVAQVGLAEYGLDTVGSLIAVELPGVGERIERGTSFGEIESVRTVQELMAPITGIVTAVNEELDEQAGLVNEDPYRDGWLIEVRLDDEDELDDLLVVEEYEDLLADRDR